MSRRLVPVPLATVVAIAAVLASGVWQLPQRVALLPAAAQSAPPFASSPPIPAGTPSSPTGPADRVAIVPAEALQRLLDRAVSRAGIPGASVTITWPDGRSWTGTSGLSDVANKVPVTAGTEFAIASMSKTFTAALILRLVEAGELSLDDHVASLLPGIKVAKSVTVKMLLDHTSGLADFFFGAGADRALLADRSAEWTAQRALGFVGPSSYKPGHGWNYSNTNYLLLGLIAERIGGATVAAQLRQAFFQPFGLTDTYVQVAERPRGSVAHGYRFGSSSPGAVPRDMSDGSSVVPFTSVVSAAGAAANLGSTSGDLARWARALYGGSVLAPETLAAAIGDARATARFHPYVAYGFGVQLTTIGGRLAYGHSGRLAGFRGEVRYLPRDGVAIAILTNQNRTSLSVLVTRLLAIALPPAPSRPLPMSSPRRE